MNEYALVWISFAKLLVLAVFVLCYTLGGRANKSIRRFLGGGILTAGLIGFSFLDGVFKWPILIISPLVIAWLCLGYTNKDGFGWLRRLVYGLFIGAIGIGLGLVVGQLWMGVFHAVLCIATSLYFGLRNPVNAVYEEAVIASCSTILLIFIV